MGMVATVCDNNVVVGYRRVVGEKARLDFLVCLVTSEDIVNQGPVLEEELPAIIRAPNKQVGTRTLHGCLNPNWIATSMKLMINLLDLDYEKGIVESLSLNRVSVNRRPIKMLHEAAR